MQETTVHDAQRLTVGRLARSAILPLLATVLVFVAASYTERADVDCWTIDHGIVALELAGTPEQATAAIDDCSLDGLRSSIVRDSLTLVPAYVIALIMWTTLASREALLRRPAANRAASRLGGMAVAAGLLDLGENGLMWLTLGMDEPNRVVTTVTAAFAGAKFALLIVVGGFVVWVVAVVMLRIVGTLRALTSPPRRIAPLSSGPVAANDEPLAERVYAAPGERSWPHETSAHAPARVGSGPVGLAMSGGGVRAASFSAGALEALRADEARRGDDGVLRRASYVSSVSGGGYLSGAFQQSNHQAAVDGPQPNRVAPYAEGSIESKTMRENIRFLWRRPTQGRFWSVTGEPGTTPWNLTPLLWAFVSQVAFNIVFLFSLVFVIARPAGWAAALVADPTRLGIDVDLFAPHTLLGLAIAAAVGGWTFNGFVGPSGRRWALTVAALAAGVAVWMRFGWVAERTWLLFFIGLASLVAFTVTGSIKKRREERAIAETKPGETVVLGRLHDYWPLPSTALLVIVGLTAGRWAWTGRADLAEGGIATGTSIDALGVAGWVLFAALLVIVGFSVIRHVLAAKPSNSTLIGALLLGAAAALTAFAASVVGTGGDVDGWRFWLVMAASVGIVFTFFDQSAWSPHRLYKERLASTFAIDRNAPTQRLDYAISTDLATWAAPAPMRPEPVFSCAANLKSHYPTGVGTQRNAQEFALGHEWVGGPEIGWSPTKDYAAVLGRQAQDVNLQAAVAVSGAAVSTAMGDSRKFEGWEAWLALFNARLGVWLPTPNYVRELAEAAEHPGQIGPWVQQRRATYLLKEVFRIYDEHDRFVNVSDGGHLDNTGLLELFKRRCTEIWYIDGTQLRAGRPEPTGIKRALGFLPPFRWTPDDAERVQMGAIGATLRLAAGAYGIEFATPLDDQFASIVSEPGTLPASSVATIRFSYPATDKHPPQVARIHVIRCALNTGDHGDENGWTGQLHAAFPSFPNVSTTNQFLEDDEFEGYVRLGRELMLEALRTLSVGDGGDEDAEPEADAAPADDARRDT